MSSRLCRCTGSRATIWNASTNGPSVGIEEIRRQIMVDTEKRKDYFDRFVYSQKFAQVDPWSERVSGKDKHEFKPMATIGLAQVAE